jgi:acyl dehydratase
MAVKQRSEVAVGDSFGPVSVPVTPATLVAYANASGDQNPIHQDRAFAESVGLPGIIAHGMWTMGASGTVVADWVGDAGRILEFRTRFTAMVPVPEEGTTIEVTGTVGKVDEDGRATIDVTTTNAGQKVLGKCVAIAQLD